MPDDGVEHAEGEVARDAEDPVDPELDQAVQQVAGAEALGGRHGERLAETEGVEFVRQRQVVRAVDLVGGHEHRAVPAAQDVGDLRVARALTALGVHDEHRHVGVGQRGARGR